MADAGDRARWPVLSPQDRRSRVVIEGRAALRVAEFRGPWTKSGMPGGRFLSGAPDRLNKEEWPLRLCMHAPTQPPPSARRHLLSLHPPHSRVCHSLRAPVPRPPLFHRRRRAALTPHGDSHHPPRRQRHPHLLVLCLSSPGPISPDRPTECGASHFHPPPQSTAPLLDFR